MSALCSSVVYFVFIYSFICIVHFCQINVVTDDRKYLSWKKENSPVNTSLSYLPLDSGMVFARKSLNKLHRMLAKDGYSQVSYQNTLIKLRAFYLKEQWKFYVSAKALHCGFSGVTHIQWLINAVTRSRTLTKVTVRCRIANNNIFFLNCRLFSSNLLSWICVIPQCNALRNSEESSIADSKSRAVYSKLQWRVKISSCIIYI